MKSLLLFLFVSTIVRAEVVRVEIVDRSAFADGMSFGPVGVYERIKGRMYLETDPHDEANARISDLRTDECPGEGGELDGFLFAEARRCAQGQWSIALRREQ